MPYQLGEEGINCLATREGFEPPTFGFGDQRSARLNYRAIIYALLPMRVLKNTVCDIAVLISSMLFNTLPFYTLALSPLAYHPVGRPHL